MSSVSPHDSSVRTSHSLIGRIQARDELAWRQLVELYGPLVFGWGRRAGLSEDDAADMLQDVFAAVARSIVQFDTSQPGRFRGWLWTITRNKIHDHHRRIIGQPVGQGGDSAWRRLEELPEVWRDDSSEATRREVRELFHRALRLIEGDFQAVTWKAFWMAVVEERSTGEIAAELGLSVNGVRQAKSRVLRRLRDELGDDSPERR